MLKTLQEVIEKNDMIHLNEVEHSIKKKIFNLSKMESLVHNDPKLSKIYDQMAEGGAEKFGYHYNEMIMNVIFNDYVLHDVNYLRKYRNSVARKKKRRDKSGINQLRSQLKPELKDKKEIDETTSSASSGSYSTASAWSSDGQTHAKPAWKGGIVVGESENKEEEVKFINDKSSEFGTGLKLRDKNDVDIIKNDIKNKQYDVENVDNSPMVKSELKESIVGKFFSDDTNFITNPEGFKNYVNFLNEEINSMATGDTPKSMLKTKDSMRIKEPLTQGASSNDTSSVGTEEPISENKKNTMFTDKIKILDKDIKLLNSISAKEPETLSDLEKLKKQNKTNAKDIVQNKVNETLSKDATLPDYIKDFTDSTDSRFEGKTKEQRRKMAIAAYYGRMNEAREINKHVVTGYEVVDDAFGLGNKIEKDMKSKEALKNRGDNPSSNGKDVVKRNFTSDEEFLAELNRGLGLEDIVFDVLPNKKYTDRIEKEMGEDLTKSRKEKLKFRAEQPLYNKEAQPVVDVKDKKTRSNKFSDNLSEALVNGRYVDGLGNKKFTTFKLSQATLSESIDEKWFPISFSGLGNAYGKTSDMTINEDVIGVLEDNQYFYNEGCGCIHVVESEVKSINENYETTKVGRILSTESFNKLSGYKPNDFVDAKHTRLITK